MDQNLISKDAFLVNTQSVTSMMLYFFVVLLGSAYIYHAMVKVSKSNITRSYLQSRFNPVTDMAMYQESWPLFWAGPSKVPHAVLLLHGYSASVEEFKDLVVSLKEAGIPYYAPMISGFGLSDMRFLERIEAEDWIRDALLSYDLLSHLAEEVSVLGHSNGGALATYVAQKRPVRHLVLSGPNIIPQQTDRMYKTMINTPVISSIMRFWAPVFLKPIRQGRKINTDTLNHEQASRCFHYPALPISSLKALWDVQDRVNIGEATFKTLSLLYGEQDLSVDINELTGLLDKRGITYTKLCFKNSAHNILEDFDKDESIKAVVDILNS
jgi:carboxylesterase